MVQEPDVAAAGPGAARSSRRVRSAAPLQTSPARSRGTRRPPPWVNAVALRRQRAGAGNTEATTDQALAAFLRRPAGDLNAPLRLCLTPTMAEMIGTAGPIAVPG